MIKTPEQIDRIRASCKIAAATLKHVGKLVVPGVTTNTLNQAAVEFMAAHNATSATLNYKGITKYLFPKETCISVNEVICHGIASEQELKEGDIVKIDVTTILDGYFGDTCKTFAVGKITKRIRHLMECGEDCLRIGINQVRSGKKIGDIGIAIGGYASSCGYGVIRAFCGHGCGISFHEEPQIHHFNTKMTSLTMEAGMVFTIEPMICQGNYDVIIDETDHWSARTADGKLSVQNEHTVLVTKTGVEILTISDT